jgi:hypothetical protein
MSPPPRGFRHGRRRVAAIRIIRTIAASLITVAIVLLWLVATSRQ